MQWGNRPAGRQHRTTVQARLKNEARNEENAHLGENLPPISVATTKSAKKEHNNQPAVTRRCASSRMEVGPDEEVRVIEEGM